MALLNWSPPLPCLVVFGFGVFCFGIQAFAKNLHAAELLPENCTYLAVFPIGYKEIIKVHPMVIFFLQNRCQIDTIGLSLYPNRATRPISNEIFIGIKKASYANECRGLFVFGLFCSCCCDLLKNRLRKKMKTQKS